MTTIAVPNASFAQPQHPSAPRFAVKVLGVEREGKVVRIGWNIPAVLVGGVDKPTWSFVVEWYSVGCGTRWSSAATLGGEVHSTKETGGSDFTGTDSSNCRQTYCIPLDHPFDVVRVRVTGKSSMLGDITYRAQEVADTITVIPGDHAGSTVDAVFKQNPELLTTCFLATSSRPDAADYLPMTSILSSEFREKSIPPGETIRNVTIGSMQVLWFEVNVDVDESGAKRKDDDKSELDEQEALINEWETYFDQDDEGNASAAGMKNMDDIFGEVEQNSHASDVLLQKQASKKKKSTIAVCIPCFEKKKKSSTLADPTTTAPGSMNQSSFGGSSGVTGGLEAGTTSTGGPQPAPQSNARQTSGIVANSAAPSGASSGKSSGITGLKQALAKRGIGSGSPTAKKKLGSLSAAAGADVSDEFELPPTNAEHLLICGYSTGNATLAMNLAQTLQTSLASKRMAAPGSGPDSDYVTSSRSLDDVAAENAASSQAMLADSSITNSGPSVKDIVVVSFAATPPQATHLDHMGDPATVETLHVFPLQQFTASGRDLTSAKYLPFELHVNFPSGNPSSSSRSLLASLDVPSLCENIDNPTTDEANTTASVSCGNAVEAASVLTARHSLTPVDVIQRFVAENCTDMSSHRLLTLVSNRRVFNFEQGQQTVSGLSMVESSNECKPVMLHAQVAFELNCSLAVTITGNNLRFVTGVALHVTPGTEVDLNIEGRTMSKLVCRQSLLPFLTPPEEDSDSSTTTPAPSLSALSSAAPAASSSSNSSPQASSTALGRAGGISPSAGVDKDGKTQGLDKLDWRREWDMHLSIRSLVGFDSYNYGPVLFPQDVVGVLMHSSSKLAVEVMLSKVVLLQPVTTRLHTTGHMITDEVTTILTQLEMISSLASATQAKHSGSSSAFSKWIHKAAAKVSTLAGLTPNNLIQVEANHKIEEVFKNKLKQWHNANQPGCAVSPQVLLEWLVQPLKSILDAVPSLKDKTYRTAILQLMKVFTGPASGAATTTGISSSTSAPHASAGSGGNGSILSAGSAGWEVPGIVDTGAAVGVLEYELHGYILKYLKTCKVNHASHETRITQFTNFSVFYYHVSKKLLATKYRDAKATDATHLFQDAVTLWCVSLMQDLRRHLRSRHFVFVCGSPTSGVSTVTSVLRQLCDDAPEDRGAGTVVAEVPNTMSLAIALDSAFDATVVLVNTIGEDIQQSLGNTFLKDIVPRIKQRRSQRCIIVRNKLDLQLIEQMKADGERMPGEESAESIWDQHVDSILGCASSLLSPRAQQQDDQSKAAWESAALGHKYGSLDLHRHRKVEGQPVDVIALYTAVAPCPDSVVELSEYHKVGSSEIIRRLASLTADELRFGVLPHTVPPPPVDE